MPARHRAARPATCWRTDGRADVTALDVSAGRPRPVRETWTGSGSRRGCSFPGDVATRAPVGRAAVRPDPARRALLGDRRDPPSSGHQAAAPGGDIPGAGRAPGRAARCRVDAAASGRAAAVHDLLSAQGGKTRPWSPLSARTRRPATRPRRPRPAGRPSGRGGTGYRVVAGRLIWTGSIMLGSSDSPDVGNEQQPEPAWSHYAAIPAARRPCCWCACWQRLQRPRRWRPPRWRYVARRCRWTGTSTNSTPTSTSSCQTKPARPSRPG